MKKLRAFTVFTSGAESPVEILADEVRLTDAGTLDYKQAEFSIDGETVAFFVNGHFNGYNVKAVH